MLMIYSLYGISVYIINNFIHKSSSHMAKTEISLIFNNISLICFFRMSVKEKILLFFIP